MPGLNDSGYTSGRSSGVLVKQQGSVGPSLDSDPAPGDTPQFKVVPTYADGKWWLSIEPGWVTRTCANALLTASNRAISVGDQSVSDSTSFDNYRQVRVEKVNCYKSLRFGSVANDLTLGQQYEADKGAGDYVLVALCCPYPGSEVRLVVVDDTQFESDFNYHVGTGSVPGDYGCTSVIQIRDGQELTVTKDVNGKVTDVTLSTDQQSYWERVALHVRILARFKPSTGELDVVNHGPQTFDMVSETYGVSVAYDDVGTAPAIIDGNWSAAFYATGDSNAPSGYTFDY